MGFLNANRPRSRKRLEKEWEFRAGVLRSLQGDNKDPNEPDINKRRRRVPNLYGKDAQTSASGSNRRSVSRTPYDPVYNDIDEEKFFRKQTKLLASVKSEWPSRYNLLSLPLELIQEIFLLSGNLEFTLCSKKLHECLNLSKYLEVRLVRRLATFVTVAAATKSEDNKEEEEEEDEEAEEPISVLNTKFLDYKFVTVEVLQELNILYTSPAFPVSNEEEVYPKDIESVPLTSEFENLIPNERSINLYLYFLSQPNCVKDTNSSAIQCNFLNMCLEAGHLEQVGQMLDYQKIAANETTLSLALECDYIDLFTKVVAAVDDNHILSHDLVWEKVMSTGKQWAMDVLRQAGGNPSLRAVMSSSLV